MALDAKGRPVLDLTTGDFAVSVDGRLRAVLAAESFTGRRTIVFVLDSASFEPISLAPFRSLATRLLDGLSPADRVTVLPLSRVIGGVDFSRQPGELRQQLISVAPRAVEAEPPLTVAEALLVLRGDRATIEEVTVRTGGAPSAPKRTDPGSSDDRRDQDAAPAPSVPPELRAAAEELLRDARTRAGDTVRSLVALMDAMGNLPGPKLVFLFTAGFLLESASDVDTIVDAAASASVTLQVLPVPAKAWGHATTVGRALGDLASATGGWLLPAGAADLVAARVASILAAEYRLTVAFPETDRARRVHDVAVSTRRKDVTLRAPRRWKLSEDTAGSGGDSSGGGRPEPGPAPGTIPPRSGRPAPPARPPSGRPDAALAAVLARSAEYLAAYEQQLSSVVAEEHYEQRAEQGPIRETRTLRSDFLLVRPPGEGGWVPFRDVFEVDGTPVRDREARLKKLFLESPPDAAMREAARVTNEGARYNIGSLFRNVNVPTLPLMFLAGKNQRRFDFTKEGEEIAGGVTAWRVRFRETGRPTLIRTREGGDVPAAGTFWLDPATGRVLKTQVKTEIRQQPGGHLVSTDTTVTYSASEGIWVPAEMREEHLVSSRGTGLAGARAEGPAREMPDQRIVGVARYSNIRRFQIIVHEKHP